MSNSPQGGTRPSRVFRLHPVAGATEHSRPESDRAVCGQCISGACCSSEGPIALTAFDVLRLSAHLDVSPARFLLLFTQDRFENCPFDPGQTIDDPQSSVVTYLRRRGPEALAPCIFLRYDDPGDSPARRVCSVHPARPLACREYYFDTCKTRWTGEMAIAMAEAFEALADGRVTVDDAHAALKEDTPTTTASGVSAARCRWQRAVWAEIARAGNVRRTNREGSFFPGVRRMQDPLARKLARLGAKTHLRFEEKYGYVPRDEQLPSDRLTLATRSERGRLLRIASTKAPRELFAGQDYPFLAGTRFLGTGFPIENDSAGAAPPGTTTAESRSAQTEAAARGVAWLGAVAWQIAHRGPSPDPAADRDAVLAAWTNLARVIEEVAPSELRDRAFRAAWRRLSSLLSGFVRAEARALARARPGDRILTRWWRSWTPVASPVTPAALRRALVSADELLGLGLPPPRARGRSQGIAARGRAHITRLLRRQSADGSWGGDAMVTGPKAWQATYLNVLMAETAAAIVEIQRANRA